MLKQIKNRIWTLLMLRRFVGPPDRLLHRFVYYSYFRKFRKEKLKEVPVVADRFLLFDQIANSLKLDEAPVDFLEFGIGKGTSFQWWLGKLHHPDSRFYGFDSFEGLPREWEGRPKGQYSCDGKSPNLSDPRALLLKGLFQETVVPFLKKQDHSRRKVIHLDADLYCSTLFVLTHLKQYLRPGDVILFDEFYFVLNEFRAFTDFLNLHPGFFYKPIAMGKRVQRLAIEVLPA